MAKEIRPSALVTVGRPWGKSTRPSASVLGFFCSRGGRGLLLSLPDLPLKCRDLFLQQVHLPLQALDLVGVGWRLCCNGVRRKQYAGDESTTRQTESGHPCLPTARTFVRLDRRAPGTPPARDTPTRPPDRRFPRSTRWR